MPRFHTPDARTGWFRRTARLLVIVLCWQSLAAAWPPVLNSAPRPRAVGLQALVGPALGPVALPPTESASKGIPWDALRATVERQARSLRLDPAQAFRLVELGGGQSAQLMTRLADAASQPASAGAPPAARPGAADSSNLRRVADARTSSDVLAARAAADPLLAPTLDADSADPFIVRKAGELGNDPVQIFAFARDEVVYESYTGSLRGARGTLWSKAGNALDQASLLIALLRASGIRARYARGTLPDADARRLILSMFSPVQRVVGCLDASAQVADPANDPKLLAEAREHYWVEFSSGGGFQAADPTFTGAQVGQTFAATQATFDEVPDLLRHKVAIRLRRELTAPQSLLGTPTQDVATVLNVTANTVEVVGKPLSLGHFVASATVPTPIFVSTTSTYSPYLIIGGDSLDSTNDGVIRGQDYQEVHTNFPFGSSILTGVFLDLDVSAPDGTTRHYERTLGDRIGLAVRRNGGSASVTADPLAPALISPLDLTTIGILPGRYDRGALDAHGPELDGLGAALTDFSARAAAGAAASDAERGALADEATRVLRTTLVAAARARVAMFQAVSDEYTGFFAGDMLVKAYLGSPRITLARTRVDVAAGGSLGVTVSLDLRKNDMRTIAFPGQNTAATTTFELVRGFVDTGIETAAAGDPDQVAGFQLRTTVSAQTIVAAAQAQGITLTLLTPDRRFEVDGLDIPADAKVLIGDALAAGKLVAAPTRSVVIDGQTRLGWYEVDPLSGETIGVLDDGSHGILENIADYLSRYLPVGVVQFGLGVVTGLGVGSIAAALKGFLIGSAVKAGLPSSITSDPRFKKAVLLAPVLGAIKAILEQSKDLLVRLPAFQAGFALGLGLVTLRLLQDPPLGNILVSPPVPGTFGNLNGTGVAAGIIADPEFTVPLGDAEVPTAFRIGIKNLTATTETFSIDLASVPPGYSARPSVPQITIPPGATAEVGVCLVPTGGIGAPGTQASFGVTVANASQSIRTSANKTFTIPAVHAVSLTADPASVSSTPGSAVTTAVTVRVAGNVAEQVALGVDVPSGLSTTGLSPVALGAGETTTQILTLTPAGNAPLDTPLTAIITGTFGNSTAPQRVSTTATVTLLASQAQAAFAGAAAANALGRPDISATLSQLAAAITGLAATPGAAAARVALLAHLDNLIAEMNAPFLADFVAQLQAARDAIASAAAGDVTAALNGLAGVLSRLQTVLRSPAAFPFDFALVPNTTVALPGQQARFKVLLRNTSTRTNTYTVSVGALPSSITGGLNVSSVTLAPGDDTTGSSPNNPVITLTQSGSSVVPTEFSVTASIAGVNGSARIATGALTVQSEFLAVTSVVATPGFTTAGGSVAVTARLANVVNESRAVDVSLEVRNAAGVVVLGPFARRAQISVQSLTTAVDFGQISAQGLPDGGYTLAVTVTDPSTGQPLPGGTGTGTLVVGLPVTATLSASPQVLPPGNGAVTTTLTVNAPGITVTGSPFSLLGSVATPSAAQALAVNGNIVYTCDQDDVSAVDVTDSAHPTVKGTAAFTSFGNGIVHCSLKQGKLVAFTDTVNTFLGNNPGFLYFGLSDPSKPVFGKFTSIQKRFFAEPDYIGNVAFVPTSGLFLCCGPQFGDLLAVDLSDFDNPRVVGTLELNQFGVFGGVHPLYSATAVNDHTLYVTGTSATGSNADYNNGLGQLQVMNVANPAAMSIVATVQVPGTVHLFKPLIVGNLAVAIGSQGLTLPCCPPDAEIGPAVVATFDITDPLNPVLLGTVNTGLNFGSGGGAQAIGNNLFLFAGLKDTANPSHLVLLQVDTTDPRQPTFRTFQIATQINRMVAAGTVLYTVGPNGLTTYSIPGVSGAQYSAAVQVDKNAKVAYDPASFSVPPTSITSGAGFDTIRWLNPGSSTLTWRSNVTGIEPGQVLPVAEGGSVSFTTALGSGTIPLPPVSVTSEQILGLDPAGQRVSPGQLARYTITLKNPTAAPLTYALGVEGLTPAWVNLAAQVTVPASGQTAVPLDVRSELAAAAGDYGFVVTAAAAGGVVGSVRGTLTLQGIGDIGSPTTPIARGVSVALVPAAATAGQGTAASFSVQVTNAGNKAETFTLSASLPAGVSGVFEQTSLQVEPGLGNFRQVLLRLTPAPGSAPATQSFTVKAVAASAPTVSAQATGSLTIVRNGLSVGLTPPSAGPGSTFQMTVKNTGQGQDTFDLSLEGTAAAVATLATTAVTLAPNASQVVQITVGSASFAVRSALGLTAVGKSRGNSAVQARATAAVTVGATTGVAAEFAPGTVNLTAPGPATFLLLVHNTGNTEDAYTGAITGTSGPVTASLTDPTGHPVQTFSTIRLPGLATGAIPLAATLTAPGQGVVQVRVTSLSNGAVTSSALAIVQTSELNHAPAVDAGADQLVRVGDTVQLAPARFTDLDAADTHTATIDWGDGTATEAGAVSERRGAGSVSGTHVYAAAGTFTVKVCVADNHGGTGCSHFLAKVVASCILCAGEPVVVDSPIRLDANNLAGTSGVLAPFVSFDGQVISIDLGHRRLHITSTGRISVLAGPGLQPPKFHQSGRHGTPDLRIASTCELVIDESVRGLAPGLMQVVRSLTGVIETNAAGGKAGDVTLAFDGAITLDGGVQSFQEELPDDPRSLPGAITVESACGDIVTGPASLIVAWGDKGSSPITVQQSQVGNIDLHGLVLNHAIQVLREPAPPVIDVIAANGDVAIDGGHVVLGQFTVSGTRYDLTSGLLTLSRDPDAVGRIAIQASGNVSVSRDLSGAPPKPPSFAAVATAITSGTPRGGVIRVRALQGGIQARDRAFQADGAGDNASALIELVADGDIAIESPSTADPAHAPTLTVAARTVNGIGRGGTVVLQSCQGDVTVGAGARVLATGPSAPGISRFTGKTVSINGVVNPPPTAGPTCEVPAPLF